MSGAITGSRPSSASAVPYGIAGIGPHPHGTQRKRLCQLAGKGSPSAYAATQPPRWSARGPAGPALHGFAATKLRNASWCSWWARSAAEA